MSLRPPKINKHKTQKKRTSGPKNSVRKRQVFEHNTKSLMNLRPQDYMNLRPQTKIVNPRLQKSCEPKANHAACSPNASGGEALRPPPQPPSSCFFFRPTLLCRDSPPPPETSPPPIETIEKKINSQNKKKIVPKIFPHPILDDSLLGDKTTRQVQSCCSRVSQRTMHSDFSTGITCDSHDYLLVVGELLVARCFAPGAGCRFVLQCL